MRHGRESHFGLEAGSKPELLLCTAALLKGSPRALLICNGYKVAFVLKGGEGTALSASAHLSFPPVWGVWG